jgi:hypothetical protein
MTTHGTATRRPAARRRRSTVSPRMTTNQSDDVDGGKSDEQDEHAAPTGVATITTDPLQLDIETAAIPVPAHRGLKHPLQQGRIRLQAACIRSFSSPRPSSTPRTSAPRHGEGHENVFCAQYDHRTAAVWRCVGCQICHSPVDSGWVFPSNAAASSALPRRPLR